MSTSPPTERTATPPPTSDVSGKPRRARLSPEDRRSGKRVFIVVAVLSIVVSTPLMGNVLTLLCRKLDATEFTIGALVLVANLAVIAHLLGTPLTERLGKHVLLTRAYAAASIFVLPLVAIRLIVGEFGPQTAMTVVFVATTLRVVTQRLGDAAWFPVMHDLVEKEQRGRFLGVMRTCWQSVNLALIIGIALLFGREPEWWHFEVVFGTAAVARIFWLIALWKIPKLPPRPDRKAKGYDWRAIFACLRDPQFVKYLAYVGTFAAAIGLIEPFRILYTTESLMLTKRFGLFATAMLSVGGIISLRYWGRLTDRAGNRGVFGISNVAMVFVSLGWLFVDGSPFGKCLIIALYLLTGVFVSANGIARTRYMLAAMENRSAQASYSALTTTVMMVSMGLSALIGGGLIRLLEGFRFEHGAITLHNQYHLLFVMSAAMFLIPNALRRSLRVKPELPTSEVLANMTRPLRTMMGLLQFGSKMVPDTDDNGDNGQIADDKPHPKTP